MGLPPGFRLLDETSEAQAQPMAQPIVAPSPTLPQGFTLVEEPSTLEKAGFLDNTFNPNVRQMTRQAFEPMLGPIVGEQISPTLGGSAATGWAFKPFEIAGSALTTALSPETAIGNKPGGYQYGMFGTPAGSVRAEEGPSMQGYTDAVSQFEGQSPMSMFGSIDFTNPNPNYTPGMVTSAKGADILGPDTASGDIFK
jgi:hypothetical protein